MGRHEDAAAALTDALALDPGDVATLDALDALQSEVGDDGGVMATLGRKLALSDAAPDRRIAWLERLGELAAARGRGDLARGAFAELAHSQPQHRWRAALARRRCGGARRRTASAALDERLVLASEIPADEQRAARLRLAARARRSDLARRGRAASVGGRRADAERAAVAASGRALEEVYTRANRWADLAVVLAHHVRIIGDETCSNFEFLEFASA